MEIFEQLKQLDDRSELLPLFEPTQREFQEAQISQEFTKIATKSKMPTKVAMNSKKLQR